MKLRDELDKRGLMLQYTNEALFDLYEQGGQKFYCGYDPTADSLTIGHLVTLMTAVHFMKKGNEFYCLIGGATGMIGDPKPDTERSFLTKEQLQHNQDAIKKQMHGLFSRLEDIIGQKLPWRLVNNYDFYANLNILDFLRDVGKHITVNTMIAKETINKRIVDPDKSISFTEFTYTLLQGYDFLHLYTQDNVRLQISGSDQWGNITTGTELIRKKTDGDVFGFTVPLIVDAHGKKFGKSEGNAIWLDPIKNSPYVVYQYFLNTADQQVEQYLRLFTFILLEEIESIQSQHLEQPHLRLGQKKLAYEICRILFGDISADQSSIVSELLFGKDNKKQTLSRLDKQGMDMLVAELASVKSGLPLSIVDACIAVGLTQSKSETRKLIEQKAIYIFDDIVDTDQIMIDISMCSQGAVLLRKGKKQFALIQSL